MNKRQHTTMYIQNRRNSSNSKGCSPLQICHGLIVLKPAIAYFAYTRPLAIIKKYELKWS